MRTNRPGGRRRPHRTRKSTRDGGKYGAISANSFPLTGCAAVVRTDFSEDAAWAAAREANAQTSKEPLRPEQAHRERRTHRRAPRCARR
jgi:hypothetical protein